MCVRIHKGENEHDTKPIWWWEKWMRQSGVRHW